jgi:single-stranded-DNA-specific exonuclease
MRWTLKPEPHPKKIEVLSKELSVNRTIAKILLQRGVESYEEAKAFFRPSLSDLHNPYLMKDMDKAVARIEKALDQGENILVYGDYDVDGTTAVALVTQYLQSFQTNIATYVPDRDTEGYGISFQASIMPMTMDFPWLLPWIVGSKQSKRYTMPRKNILISSYAITIPLAMNYPMQ